MHGSLNIWQILWESGVVVKIVLIILVMASVLSWTIILQKYKELKAITEANEKFSHFFKSSNSLTDINREATENHESTMSLMFRRGYEELNKVGEKLSGGSKGSMASYFSEHGFQALERALKTGYNTANEKMDIRVATLASIGSITPFIGLFGTVWGIIDAFSGLSTGGGSIEAVAPGIAEALVATAVGLAAAIPAVWFFNVFNNKITRINSQMETFSQDFLNLIERSILIKRINSMGMNLGGGKKGPVSDINVTPLVDVMLVLLVIFMVTAPMLFSGIDLKLPKTQKVNNVGLNQEMVILSVTSSEQYFIGKNLVMAKDLIPSILKQFTEKKVDVLYLRADYALKYEKVAKLIAALKKAGVSNIALVTEVEKSEDK